jgi:hypothetical protein
MSGMGPGCVKNLLAWRLNRDYRKPRSMIRKSMPSGYYLMGGHRFFAKKTLLKQKHRAG